MNLILVRLPKPEGTYEIVVEKECDEETGTHRVLDCLLDDGNGGVKYLAVNALYCYTVRALDIPDDKWTTVTSRDWSQYDLNSITVRYPTDHTSLYAAICAVDYGN